MQVHDGTVRAALEKHFDRYADGKAWNIDDHVKMWETARRAFGQSSFPDFEELYKELRNSWQVFRGSASHWLDRQTFDTLIKCDRRLAQARLSCIGKHDLPAIWEIIQSLREIKTNKVRPSVVAVSKFLHFWNPRLFMIVDDGVVWKHVFAHAWLRKQVERTRLETDRLLGYVDSHDDAVCDLPTYFAVLAWASQLVRENPCIAREFDKYIRRKAKVSVSDEVAEYEAAAIEWFLLGLVELPPAGVTIEECDVPPREQ